MRSRNLALSIILIIIIIYSLFNTDAKEGMDNNNNNNNNNPPFPIDVVYTWAGENHSDNARTSNNNELKYSLRSVMKYAPWVNKIYILMNPPKTKPSWFNKEYSNKIVIVDHNDSFINKRNLPSKNSNSIETTIVNIPGLSENFIYFNDDFYLGNNVSYLDFFNQDGSKIIVDADRIKNCKSMVIENKQSKMNIELPQYCGIANHIPFANKKSIIKDFQKKYGDYTNWVQSIKRRRGTGGAFCSKQNLHHWCQQQHGPIAKFAYDNGLAEIFNFYQNDIIYIDHNYDKQLQKLAYINHLKPKFYCINDVKIDSATERRNYYKKVNDFMNKYYSEKPFFEK